MAVLHCIGITIDEKYSRSAKEFSEQKEKQQMNREGGGEMWKPEVTIYPLKAKNIFNSFVLFWYYKK